MLDNILCARAMGEYSLEHAKSAISNTAVLFDNNSTDLLEEYMKSRGFTDLHRVLLGVHDHDISLPDYLRAYPHTVDWKDHQGRSPLAWAVEYGWADAAETLIGFGANFDQLRTSARGGASPLLHLAIAGPRSRKTVAIVRVLLNAGINVNAIDEEGWTAMHIAASWNFYEVVAEIVQRQPDLSMFTIVGETAHDLAVQAGADDSVKRLLQIPCCL
jgi:ankyrin repeat protein